MRFLAVLLAGWATARGIDLYRRDGGDLNRVAAPVVRAVAALAVHPAAATTVRRQERGPANATVQSRPPRLSALVRARMAPHDRQPAAVPPARGPAPQDQTAVRDRPPVPMMSPAVLPPTIAARGTRFAGSAWFIGRNGSAPNVATSQLGASQAGVRATYALDRRHRLALAARMSAPLSGRGKEAAFGIDWQPTRAPIHIVAERRFALDDGMDGSMIGIVGGFGPQAVAPGLQLEGYGQAGVIARVGVEAFGDGAVRASRPLPPIGALRIDIGAGIWGGAQRGAARVDIGPSVGVVVPIGRGAVRVTGDWRQRIAGSARPESGPALSLGTNF